LKRACPNGRGLSRKKRHRKKDSLINSAMKIYIKIDDTGGYPKGIIQHMMKVIKAFKFQLNFFYDANIFKHLAHR
jgi:hypothetical protein